MNSKKFYRYGKHFNAESCNKRKAARLAHTKVHGPLNVYINNETWKWVDTSTISDKDVFVKYYLPEIGKGILFVIVVLLALIIWSVK